MHNNYCHLLTRTARRAASAALALLFLAIPVATLAADHQSDIDAINQLIDRYGAYQEKADAIGMSELMAKDRTVLSRHFGGRRIDNVRNMKIQQEQLNVMKKEVPGMQEFIEDQDRLIRFYGDGKVAVVSFFRFYTRVFPAGTSADLMQKYAADAPLSMTLVLEKRGAQWIIVHTHA